MNAYGYVYLTLHRPSGKRYVGQKKGDFRAQYLGSGRLLQRAVNKHGSAEFSVTVLERARDREHLDDLEKLYIREQRELYPKELILNIADGGIGTRVDGLPFMTGKTHSPATRAQMSASRSGPRNWLYGNGHLISGENNPAFGCTHSAESRRRTGEGNKKHRGAEHGNYGKVRTPEMRAKVSAANKGRVSAMKGKIASAESRAKLSATRKAMFAAGYKMTYSAETRKKISDGRKRYWAARRNQPCA